MEGAALGADFFLSLAIPALLIWLVVDALRNGGIKAVGRSYSRSENPVMFAVYIGLYVALTALAGDVAIHLICGKLLHA